MVPFESTYVRVAEADLNSKLGFPVKYTNGGVSSWDLPQYLVRVNEAVDRGAGVISVGIPANDFNADLSEKGLEVRAALRDAASIEDAYQEVYVAKRPMVERLYRSALSRSWALDLVVHLVMPSDEAYAAAYLWRKGRDSYLSRPLAPTWIAKLAAAERLLRRMSEAARSGNAKLVVIAIPQRIQVLLHSRSERYSELDAHALFDELGRICRSLDIAFIDGFEPLSSVERLTSLYFPGDGHLTSEGQERLGHSVADELVRLRVVSDPAGMR